MNIYIYVCIRMSYIAKYLVASNVYMNIYMYIHVYIDEYTYMYISVCRTQLSTRLRRLR